MSEQEIIYQQAAIMAEQRCKIASLEKELAESKANEKMWWDCYQKEEKKNRDSNITSEDIPLTMEGLKNECDMTTA